eukprot:COSAG02_NODE_38138_length_432_cov_10864.093093_1_plen_75_part_10
MDGVVLPSDTSLKRKKAHVRSNTNAHYTLEHRYPTPHKPYTYTTTVPTTHPTTLKRTHPTQTAAPITNHKRHHPA